VHFTVVITTEVQRMNGDGGLAVLHGRNGNRACGCEADNCQRRHSGATNDT
jgi:hypothetical protein